ncbi:hypothetical protein D3C76_1179180 [compost metagenome]
MIVSWISQTVPVEVITVLTQTTVIHIGIQTGMSYFLTIIDHWLALCSDLQRCSDLLLTLNFFQSLCVQCALFKFASLFLFK